MIWTRTVLAVLVAAFVAGVAAGVGGSELAEHHHDERGRNTPIRRDKHEAHLLSRLDLTGGQRAQTDSIVARRRAEMQSVWDSDGARLRGIVDSTRADLRAVLTPPQRAKYDSLRLAHEHHEHDDD